jgi:hypothetical protein
MQNPEDRIERQARRRAGMKMGWYIHASVYVAVNLMLYLVSTRTGGHWAMFPAFGWGIGLAAHGIVVFLATGGAGVQEQLVERERRKLRAQQEPW